MLFWKTKPWSLQLWWTKKVCTTLRHQLQAHEPGTMNHDTVSCASKTRITYSVIFSFFCFSFGGEMPWEYPSFPSSGYIRAQPPLMSGRYGEYSTRCGLGEAFVPHKRPVHKEPNQGRRTLFTGLGTHLQKGWCDMILCDMSSKRVCDDMTRKKVGVMLVWKQIVVILLRHFCLNLR